MFLKRRSPLIDIKKVSLLLSIAIVLLILPRYKRPESTPKELMKATVSQDLDSLRYLVKERWLPMAKRENTGDSLRILFYKCREAYKKVEFVTEYFAPSAARFVNGPPLDEIETAESEVNEPGGFQVIEAYLFPETDTTQRAALVQEIEKLHAHLVRVRTIWEVKGFTDAHVFDAMRLQVFRIITLGISGFDTALSKRAMAEAAVSLAAMQKIVSFYEPTSDSDRQLYKTLQQVLQESQQYLLANQAFDTFNRMNFITRYANPLTSNLLLFGRSLGYEPFRELRALRGDAATLFDKNAFDANFFAPNPDSYTSNEKIALGQMLFFDPLLSSDNSRSCATCHQPDKAFTDGLPASMGFVKGKFVKRNAPTLLNAALQHTQFYDSRSGTLEHQAIEVVENEDEMHGSLTEAVRKLQQRKDYREAFRAAYPAMNGSIQPMQVQNALASFVRSLTSLNSRFDQYMRGEATTLTGEEMDGFNLFMGKAKCGTCHFMPLFNGTVPPGFTHTETEVLGVPARGNKKQLDTDLGKFAVFPFEQLKFSFKTPTLRNIERTAPYMHNGVYQTLEEVIDFYDQGGGAGLGIDLPNQTLPAEPLDLTAKEKKALIVFMKTLTDTKVAGGTFGSTLTKF